MRFPRSWWSWIAIPLVVGACKGGATKALPATLPSVQLPADDLQAGRALGKAAATETDPAKLAATIVAFLERLHVPVVSQKGDALLAKGPFAPYGHKALWLWEPVVVGVARATTMGDRRPLAEVLSGFGTTLDPKKVAQIDFGALVSEIADAAAHQPLPVFGPLAAALEEDLKQRHELRARPHLDPTATLLVGLLLYAEQSGERQAPVPAPTPTPTARPAFPFPLPLRPGQTAHAMGAFGGGGGGPGGVSASTACKWIAKATSIDGSVFEGIGGGLGKLKSWGAHVGLTLSPGLDAFLTAITPALEGASLAETITEGISGMGIAAFVVTDGKVSPTKVKYGDGPATYTVTVKSESPFDKEQLDQFVDCLEASAPALTAGTIDNLRNIPPKGGMADVPVLWMETSQYDPKHGTFTPSNGSVPDGIVAPLVKAGLSAVGGGTTDGSGQTKATFQVKPKRGQSGGASRFKRYTITAKIFPFPVGLSVVYGASNVLFNRDEPIALEIEVPLDDWILDVDWKLQVQPTGAMVHFEDDGHARVKFKLDPNDLTFHQTGTGTHAYSIPPQTTGPGAVTCSAPAGTQPVTITIDGKVTDYETMQAQVHLDIKPDASTEAMTITCRSAFAPAHPSTRHAQARVGDIAEGTKLKDFTIVLDDGEALDLPIDKTAGPMQIDGPAHVAVSIDGGG